MYKILIKQITRNMKNTIVLECIWIFFACLGIALGGNSTHRTTLHQDITSGYDTSVYPSTNYSIPFQVSTAYKRSFIQGLGLMTPKMVYHFEHEKFHFSSTCKNVIYSCEYVLCKILT